MSSAERRWGLASVGRSATDESWWRRGRRLSAVAVALGGGPLFVLGLAQCVDDSFADGQFLCDPALTSEQCPPGQLCAADGRCHYSGLDVDSGVDSGIDSGVDAGPDACVPRTCDELIPACPADASDQCGQPLDCTSACPGNSTCGGAGVLGQCGCPPLEWQDGSPGRVTTMEWGQLDAAWQNWDAGLAQDGVAVITQSIPEGRDTDFLVFDHMGLDIPVGARIQGIVVRAWRSTQPGSPDTCVFRTQTVDLKWGPDEAPDASTKASTADNWPLHTEGGDVVRSYGTELQTWDVPWTAEQLNAPDFGLRIQAQCNGPAGSAARARVDYADLTVYYEPACDL